jgi:hypothetical protein
LTNATLPTGFEKGFLSSIFFFLAQNRGNSFNNQPKSLEFVVVTLSIAFLGSGQLFDCCF